MMNHFRVALILVGIATATVSQIVGNPFQIQKDSPALENEYVRVTVIPRLTRTPTVLADCRFPRPSVLVYVPTYDDSSTSASAQRQGRGNASARFIGPDQIVGCPIGWPGGTAVWIDLKSQPPASSSSSDAVKLDPVHNEVVFENEQVRVVRIHFEPGESGPIVDKRPRVIFARTDSHATVTFSDGHSEARDMKAGTVSFGNAGRQATKNTGTTPLENIVVELKSR